MVVRSDGQTRRSQRCSTRNRRHDLRINTVAALVGAHDAEEVFRTRGESVHLNAHGGALRRDTHRLEVVGLDALAELRHFHRWVGANEVDGVDDKGRLVTKLREEGNGPLVSLATGRHLRSALHPHLSYLGHILEHALKLRGLHIPGDRVSLGLGQHRLALEARLGWSALYNRGHVDARGSHVLTRSNCVLVTIHLDHISRHQQRSQVLSGIEV